MASISDTSPKNTNISHFVNPDFNILGNDLQDFCHTQDDKIIPLTSEQKINTSVGDVVQAVNNFVLELEENETNEPKYESIVDKLADIELNLDNFEDLFSLREYKATSMGSSFQEKTHNIIYKDEKDNTMAMVKIDFKHNRLIMEFLGNNIWKHRYSHPNEVFKTIYNMANSENWSKEDGGVNQFNGNIEFRYKNSDNHVMAAIISTSEGQVENIVQYEYKNGKKSKMINTGLFGETTTIYDTSKEVSLLMSIEIDTDGNIIRISKDFGN